MKKGFTLIELVVVIAVMAVLSGIILFSVTQYINRGKDSNVSGNLAVLIPAGEVYYNANGNSYAGFCDVSDSVMSNAVSQMPKNSSYLGCYASLMPYSGDISRGNPAGLCCHVASDGNSWYACAPEFTNPTEAYCVDSRGMKKEFDNSYNICSDPHYTNCDSFNL